MASRALIIAVESYPNAELGVAKRLDGTIQAATDFKVWLEAKWQAEGVAPADTDLVFCSSPAVPGHRGATSDDILKAIYDLKGRGRGMTDELFVFFSGHGFAFIEKPGSRADVILAADFADGKLRPGASLNLDMIIQWFRDHMGAGKHYYFIDACRNNLNGTQVSVPASLVWDPATSEDASSFVLQSTAPGAVSAVGGNFPKVLIEGLKGKGRAKVWEGGATDRMFVRYDSLRSFVKRSVTGTDVTSKVTGADGESDGVLATLRPVPKTTFTINITGATKDDRGVFVLTRGRSSAGNPKSFLKVPLPQTLEPDDYQISVQLVGALVTPGTPVPVDLYDDNTVTFTKVVPPPPPPPPPPGSLAPPSAASPPPSGDPLALPTMPGVGAAKLDVVVPLGAQVWLRNLATGSTQVLTASQEVAADAGSYLASLQVRNATVRRIELDVTSRSARRVDLADWRSSLPHRSIADRLPLVHGAPDFSESLGGAVVDPDLELWLALLGGGRIIGSRAEYSKLVTFPLHDFGDEPRGASPTYVIAGFNDPDAMLFVGTSQGRLAPFQLAVQPPQMPGIREAYFPTPPGPQIVSVRLNGGASYSVASYAMENRATLITLTEDDDGDFRVAQYLLPVGHLIDFLPYEVDARGYKNYLEDVRFLARASRAFRRRRSLGKNVGTEMLDQLLATKWLDPIGSTMASYELIRRGTPRTISHVVDNLLKYFEGLPDSAALARLAGRDVRIPKGVPLFFDGLRAFEREIELPLPASHLDFASSWTAWRGAVSEAHPFSWAGALSHTPTPARM